MLTRHELPDGAVIQGHVLDALASLPAESIQCCITSPPYYGLRKYSGDQDTQWSNGFGAYGLERTPQEWADRTLEWLRAVRRVLRKDGTVWLNVGSSYAAGDIGSGYKPLDLIDPFALLYPGLLADGWYVRSVVIWAKPNPMPESVAGWRWDRCRTLVKSQGEHNSGAPELRRLVVNLRAGTEKTQWADCPGCPKCAPNDGLVLRRGSWRPTSSYEYVIMLAKSATYFADGEAVREKLSPTASYGGIYRENGKTASERNDADTLHGVGVQILANPAGRNLRDVWQIPTQSFPESHFATYPEELVKRCILASTPDAGVCAVCGAPLARVIEQGELREDPQREGRSSRPGADFDGEGYPLRNTTLGMVRESTTTGWRATCQHLWCDITPSTILDPFGGSMTSAVVARSLGRRFVCIELSEDYVQMGLRRLMLTQPAMVGLV